MDGMAKMTRAAARSLSQKSGLKRRGNGRPGRPPSQGGLSQFRSRFRLPIPDKRSGRFRHIRAYRGSDRAAPSDCGLPRCFRGRFRVRRCRVFRVRSMAR